MWRDSEGSYEKVSRHTGVSRYAGMDVIASERGRRFLRGDIGDTAPCSTHNDMSTIRLVKRKPNSIEDVGLLRQRSLEERGKL